MEVDDWEQVTGASGVSGAAGASAMKGLGEEKAAGAVAGALEEVEEEKVV